MHGKSRVIRVIECRRMRMSDNCECRSFMHFGIHSLRLLSFFVRLLLIGLISGVVHQGVELRWVVELDFHHPAAP